MVELPDSGKIKDAANAVKGLLDAFPVYKDLFQPSAQTIGGELQKAVHAGLMPLRLLVWSAEQLEAFLTRRLAEKLQGVPVERIRTPDPIIAGPTLEALRFAGGNETLREMFATLLATSMDAATAGGAHPSFVEFIRNLAPDEAKIMHLFANNPEPEYPVIDLLARYKGKSHYKIVVSNFSLLGYDAACDRPRRAPSYIENLCRLGLVEIPDGQQLAKQDAYESLEGAIDVTEISDLIRSTSHTRLEFKRKVVRLSNLGDDFCFACVRPHSEHKMKVHTL
jgi:hypothetical protein